MGTHVCTHMCIHSVYKVCQAAGMQKITKSDPRFQSCLYITVHLQNPYKIIPFSQEDTTHNNTCSQNTSYIPKSQLNNSVRWRLSWGQNSICMAPLFLSETTACPSFILTQSVRFLSMHAGKTSWSMTWEEVLHTCQSGVILRKFPRCCWSRLVIKW